MKMQKSWYILTLFAMHTVLEFAFSRETLLLIIY